MPDELLFIKVILPKQGLEKMVKGGGGKPKVFKAVTPELRQSLIGSISDVEKVFRNAPRRSKIVPAKVTLETKALAKSHRPDHLFTVNTCPIIGAGKPGELYVKATPGGVNALKLKVAENQSNQIEKELSTLQDIRPVSASDRLDGKGAEELLHEAPRFKDQRLIKVRLFQYGRPEEEQPKAAAFEGFLREGDVPFTKATIYSNQDVYVIGCRKPSDVDLLANAVMVRSVSKQPVFSSLETVHSAPKPLPTTLQRPSPNQKEFPIVAVVDSGVQRNIGRLDEWIYDREEFVAGQNIDTSHGTFVAGLIVWGHELNATLAEVGSHSCRVLDVHVLPRQGATQFIQEHELLETLKECLDRHANDVKVWNLSLGSDQVCRLDRFSEFAYALDDLQEAYGVSFVISAGNYEIAPLLGYPRNPSVAEVGRITVPADSVLGITVGAVSHANHPTTGTRLGEPAPFSRNGPGPNYIIKPDLVHFGGNSDKNGGHRLGIVSVSNDGQSVVESVGTSFSAPFISRQLAHVYHRVIPTPTPTLARAILTHSARDLRTKSRVRDEDDHCLGFGIPLKVEQALECKPWMATLVFEEVLRPRYFLEWDDFPYPESLISNGRYRGEIWMTIAYPPKRNVDYGSEYCETHVEAHFGVYRDVKDKKKGRVVEKFTGLVPLEHNNKGRLYETFQVEQLRKWAPVRTYHALLKRGGEEGKRWRLKVRLLSRHGVDEDLFRVQPFALLLTIADPNQRAPVYNEMARKLRTRYQSKNLMLRPIVQIRSRT